MNTKPKTKAKIMIMGFAGHGKDTLAEQICAKDGYSFSSSSEYVCEHVVYPALKDKLGYASAAECFADRKNHRETWFNLIKDYCAGDEARLIREILSQHDIYCGIRRREEFLAAKAEGLFDFAVWVDASDRLPPEDQSSCTVTADDADFVVDNNGPESELYQNFQTATLKASRVALAELSGRMTQRMLESRS